MQADREYNLVVWDEGKTREEQTKRLMDKFRELKEMTGKTTFLYITTKRIDHEGNKIEREQMLTKIETDCSELDCYENLMRVRDFMEKNVALYSPGDARRVEIFGKMAECIFGGTGLNCCVYRSSSKKENSQKGRDTDAIIVSQEGKSYADLLKVVKEEDKNTTDNIDTVRQTKERGVLITLRADEKKTREL